MSTDYRSPRLHRAVPLVAPIAIVAWLVAAGATHARGPVGRGGPSAAECEAARCKVADAIADACPCALAVTHGQHVRCVSRATKGLVLLGAIPNACRRTAVRCARRASCGRANRVACRVMLRRGGERCAIVPPARCTGMVSLGSCCAQCPTTTTTTLTPGTTTTTTLPAGTTTTTTTSTSTTSSTLVACGGIYPVCLGSCPLGSLCLPNIQLGGCFCSP